jgi:hypothetical protein
MWLAPAAFVALLAFRLGLPVMDAGSGHSQAPVPARCAFCGVAGVVGVWGLHALSCVAPSAMPSSDSRRRTGRPGWR